MGFYQNALNVWKEIAPYHTIKRISYDLEFQKKVLSLIQPGKSYYFFFNVNHGNFDFINMIFMKSSDINQTKFRPLSFSTLSTQKTNLFSFHLKKSSTNFSGLLL